MTIRETWGLTLILTILAFGAIGFAIAELLCLVYPPRPCQRIVREDMGFGGEWK